MPPVIFRGRGRGRRGRGEIVTHHDHEAGPSNTRATSPQGVKNRKGEETFTNPRGIPPRTARRHPTGTPLGQTQKMIPTTHNLPSYLYNVRYHTEITTTLLHTS